MSGCYGAAEDIYPCTMNARNGLAAPLPARSTEAQEN